MRGGALPLLAWGGLLAVLMAGNWVWTGDAIQVGTFAFALLAILLVGALLAARHREAIRRGPPAPPPPGRVEAAPDLSFGAVMAAIAVASILFGLTWAYFLVYFGAGLLILSLGRLAQELQGARASRERYEKAPSSQRAVPQQPGRGRQAGGEGQPGREQEERP